MATKKIALVRFDPIGDRLRFLYDDNTEGALSFDREKLFAPIRPDDFVGLTLKQAKMKLGVKGA